MREVSSSLLCISEIARILDLAVGEQEMEWDLEVVTEVSDLASASWWLSKARGQMDLH